MGWGGGGVWRGWGEEGVGRGGVGLFVASTLNEQLLNGKNYFSATGQ